jgi:hypothetical protein
MSTRSSIARQNTDGTFDLIYCHSDGDPEWNGRFLLQHYATPEQVDALLALGNLSALAPKIGTKHAFRGGPEDECIAYGRDRDEEDQEAERGLSRDDFRSAHQDTDREWVYVYRVASQRWFFSKTRTFRFRELTVAAICHIKLISLLPGTNIGVVCDWLTENGRAGDVAKVRAIFEPTPIEA